MLGHDLQVGDIARLQGDLDGAALDPVRFDQAWTAGASMTVLEAVDHAAGLCPATLASLTG